MEPVCYGLSTYIAFAFGNSLRLVSWRFNDGMAIILCFELHRHVVGRCEVGKSHSGLHKISRLSDYLTICWNVLVRLPEETNFATVQAVDYRRLPVCSNVGSFQLKSGTKLLPSIYPLMILGRQGNECMAHTFLNTRQACIVCWRSKVRTDTWWYRLLGLLVL